MKFIRQNVGLMCIIIISLVLSAYTSFVLGKDITVYERSKGIYEGLLGLLIASYAIYISFISKLVGKVSDKGVLTLLNYYFLINILVIFLINILYVIYPLFGITDSYYFRFLYYFGTGMTLLVIWYLFISARHFIKE